ncbi:hypothetical protein ACXWRO_09055, partial [Streptococcus pyogenes]
PFTNEDTGPSIQQVIEQHASTSLAAGGSADNLVLQQRVETLMRDAAMAWSLHHGEFTVHERKLPFVFSSNDH